MNLPGLGDMHLMNSMLSLLPYGHKPGFLFKFLFLNSLPTDIRSHLVNVKIDELRDLAVLADQLWSSTQVSPFVCPVTVEPDFLPEMNAVPNTRN